MKINTKKFLGWRLDSISIDNETFSLNFMPPRAYSGLQRPSARIIFSSVKKLVLSKVLGGAEISQIKQGNDSEGRVICVLEFSSDSFIEITAGTFTDLRF